MSDPSSTAPTDEEIDEDPEWMQDGEDEAADKALAKVRVLCCVPFFVCFPR